MNLSVADVLRPDCSVVIKFLGNARKCCGLMSSPQDQVDMSRILTHSWCMQATDEISSGSMLSNAPVQAAGLPSPGGLRKKKITRRVGYARDDSDDVPPPKAVQAPKGDTAWGVQHMRPMQLQIALFC